MPEAQELIIDSFAGGGGASTGIEMALGRSPDIAINHDAEALAMHRANHPETLHVSKNVWQVDPLDLVGRRPVGLAWFSPDCKHFSKAKGGRPVKRSIRDLAWVVVLWARRARPRVIILENVEEFQEWGPLVEREPGNWMPCPDRRGATFKRWVGELKRLGYRVEWRELRACDYGAPTIRKRLFLIARRDGRPIVWPEPTHGRPDDPEVVAGRRLPWRTAAEIIDWSLPCPSIFLTREEARAIGVKRPLAEATMARIAKGVRRYVLDNPRPFIVGVGGRMGQSPPRPVDRPAQTVTTKADSVVVTPFVSYGQQGGLNRAPDDPLHTVTASKKDTNAVVAPVLASLAHGESGGRRAYPVEDPVRTIHAGGGKHALAAVHLTKFRANSVGSGADEPVHTVTANSHVARPGGAPPMGVVAAFLAQHNEGPRPGQPGRLPTEPVSTLTATGAQQAVVSAGLMNMKGAERASWPVEGPTPTQTAAGQHVAEVRAFLMKYYGVDQDPRLEEPLHTATTRDRFGLVMVEGEPYEIVDIGMRMLSRRELFAAQGFPARYIIDRGTGEDGAPVVLTKTASIRMCGNSVCPPLAAALVEANCGDLAVAREAAE